MNHRVFGTVLVVIHRPLFVILGADTGRIEESGAAAGQANKLVCHSTLPLAVAVGGMGEFTISNKTTVVAKLLEDQMASWAKSVNIGDINSWARTVLLPLVQEANAAYPDKPPSPVHLVVGYINRGKAESGVINVCEKAEIQSDARNKTGVLPPATLGEWRKALETRSGDPYGKKAVTAFSVASKAKLLIEDAIATDKQLAGDGPPHCSGYAEVVAVESGGARFKFQAPINP